MNFFELFALDFQAIAPEIILTVALTATLLFGAFNPSQKDNVAKLSVCILLYTLAGLCFVPVYDYTLASGMLVVDQLSHFAKIFTVIGAIASLVLVINYSHIKHFEYSILIMLATLGILLLISANDLISIYLAIELQSLAFYVLAAFYRDSEYSIEAGLKYFVLGAFSTGLYLFGSSLIYGFTGMTNLNDLTSLFVSATDLIWGPIVLGMIFVLVAILFKLGAAPFHMWLPDVYEGAPTPVTAFFAITPKIGLLVVLSRVTFYGLIEYWQPILISCALASMLIGAFGALYQVKIKRMLAYSAINHVGYLLLALATGTTEGLQAVLFYAVVYMAMSINMFILVVALRNDENDSIVYIDQLAGLAKSNPVVAFSLAATLFSMSGCPPLAGFCGKLYIFLAALQASFYASAIIGVLLSVVSAVFYIRIVKIMYFDEAKVSFGSLTPELALITASTSIFIIGYFLSPSYLLEVTHKVALATMM